MHGTATGALGGNSIHRRKDPTIQIDGAENGWVVQVIAPGERTVYVALSADALIELVASILADLDPSSDAGSHDDECGAGGAH